MKLFKVFIFFIFLVLKVQSLALCLSLCGTSCFASSFKPVSMDICMAACAAGTRNCFSDDTTIQVQRNKTIIETSISNIKEKDQVLTLKNGEFSLTNVVQILQNEGNFTFYELKAQNSEKKIKKIKLTEDHGLIVIKNNQKFIVSAKNIKKGNLIITNEGIFSIYDISIITQNKKYTLYTEDGTILASDIYVSTICEPDIDETIPFEELMEDWRQAHETINSYIK